MSQPLSTFDHMLPQEDRAFLHEHHKACSTMYREIDELWDQYRMVRQKRATAVSPAASVRWLVNSLRTGGLDGAAAIERLSGVRESYAALIRTVRRLEQNLEIEQVVSSFIDAAAEPHLRKRLGDPAVRQRVQQDLRWMAANGAIVKQAYREDGVVAVFHRPADAELIATVLLGIPLSPYAGYEPAALVIEALFLSGVGSRAELVFRLKNSVDGYEADKIESLTDALYVLYEAHIRAPRPLFRLPPVARVS